MQFVYGSDPLSIFGGSSGVRGMAMENGRLVIYHLAEVANGKIGKFAFATGSIPVGTNSSAGLVAPGIADTAKGWRFFKSDQTNTKIVKPRIKDGALTIKVGGPGYSEVMITNISDRVYKEAYAVVLPVEVRLPRYASMELTYGPAKKPFAPLNFAYDAVPGKGGIPAKTLDTLEKGEKWQMTMICIGERSVGTAIIPAATRYVVDKAGNGIWASQDPAIATINSKGQLKGISPGVASLVFTDYLGEQFYFSVEVVPKKGTTFGEFTFKATRTADESKVKSYVRSESESSDLWGTATVEMEEGSQFAVQLDAKRNDKDSKKLPFFSYSSDPTAAYIDGSGNLCGLQATSTDVKITLVFFNQPTGKLLKFEVWVTVKAK